MCLQWRSFIKDICFRKIANVIGHVYLTKSKCFFPKPQFKKKILWGNVQRLMGSVINITNKNKTLYSSLHWKVPVHSILISIMTLSEQHSSLICWCRTIVWSIGYDFRSIRKTILRWASLYSQICWTVESIIGP